MTIVMSLASNKERNSGVRRSRRRSHQCKTSIPSLRSLQILVLLVLIPRNPIQQAAGWSQSNFVVRSGVRQSTLVSWPAFSRKEYFVKLQASSVDRQSDFFEDPSKTMQNGFNTTDIATENDMLRNSIRILEEENERLKTFVEEQHQKEFEGAAVEKVTTNQRIVLETFEGEGLFEVEEDDSELWCDVLDGEECPIEPRTSFGDALRDRAYWLVGLLIMQSLSGIILSRNEMLLANHPVIIYYLTMMVGAGGNAGNQASVRVIRGLALGTLNERTRGQFLVRELKMAATLSFILSIAGFVRTICFKTPLPEAITVTTALSLIVFISVCLGAILPLILERIGVDPAHSSTTIQVIMDILGVLLAVVVSGAILDGPLGAWLLPKLGY